MQKVITVTNPKGGVGKTTISVNLGGALADLGLRVLFFDTDTQQSTTRFLGVDPNHRKGLVEFIHYGDPGAITEAQISKNLKGHIDVVANNDPNNGLKQFLNESITHSFNFANAIKDIQHLYDVVIIDTKGEDGRGEIKESAVLAADLLLVPCKPAGLEASEIDKNINAFELIHQFKSMNLTRSEPVMKILINAAERTNLSKDVSKHLREKYSSHSLSVTVLANVIPMLSVYKGYFTDRDFVHRLDKRPRNGVDPAPPAAETMLALVHELFPNLIDLNFDTES